MWSNIDIHLCSGIQILLMSDVYSLHFINMSGHVGNWLSSFNTFQTFIGTNFYQFIVHLFISLGPRDYVHLFCCITINLNLITVRYAATQQGVLIYPIVSLAVSMVGICPFLFSNRLEYVLRIGSVNHSWFYCHCVFGITMFIQSAIDI